MARLAPRHAPTIPRSRGIWRGQVAIRDDFDELPDDLMAAFNGQEPDVYVSAVSVWEIATKRALGKLEAPEGLVAAVAASGLRQLPIEFRHAEVAGALPRHHDDPFDRLPVTQAECESLALVTSDARITNYQVAVLSAS